MKNNLGQSFGRSRSSSVRATRESPGWPSSSMPCTASSAAVAAFLWLGRHLIVFLAPPPHALRRVASAPVRIAVQSGVLSSCRAERRNADAQRERQGLDRSRGGGCASTARTDGRIRADFLEQLIDLSGLSRRPDLPGEEHAQRIEEVVLDGCSIGVDRHACN